MNISVISAAVPCVDFLSGGKKDSLTIDQANGQSLQRIPKSNIPRISIGNI